MLVLRSIWFLYLPVAVLCLQLGTWYSHAALSLVTLLFAWALYPAWRWAHMPGPPTHLFTGNLGQLGDRACWRLEEWQHEYGDLYVILLGRKPVLVLSDPDAVHTINVGLFHHFKNRVRPPIEYRTNKGLVLARGAAWKRMRNALVPMFHEKRVANMSTMMNEACDALVAKVDSVRRERTSNIDIFPILGQHMMQIIAQAFLGVNPDHDVHQYETLTEAAQTLFLTGGYAMLATWWVRIFPCLKPIVMRMPRVRRQRQVVLDAVAKVDQVSDQVREDRVIRRQMGNNYDEQTLPPAPASAPDFVDLLLDTRIAEEGNRHLDEDEMRDQSNTFLMAGYEGAANTMAFIVYWLAMHPEAQVEVQREVDAFYQAGRVGKSDDKTDDSDEVKQSDQSEQLDQTDQHVSFSELHRFPYVRAVVMETMRLFPSATALNREAAEDTVVMGRRVPKGTHVLSSILNMHRSTQHWGPDAHAFRPERWLVNRAPEVDGDQSVQDQWELAPRTKEQARAFLPFGSGARKCIGERVAVYELVLTTIRLCRRFSFTLSYKQDPLATIQRFNLAPRHGVVVNIASRTS